MKINEITESLTDPKITTRQLSNKFPITKLANFSKKRGNTPNTVTGAYAWGSEDPNDPFLYRKKSRVPSYLEKDSYYQYISTVVIPNQNNPFFPRIYDVILKRDTDGIIKPEYRIEKLNTFIDIQNNYGSMELNSLLFNNYFQSTIISDKINIIILLKNLIDSNYLNGKLEIKNKYLAQAILLIKKLIDSNDNFSHDIYKDNVMFRIGKGIPQLVFTDPVHDHGNSVIGPYSPFRADD